MKILWLSNVMLPSVSKVLGQKETVFGGWLTGLSRDLAETDGVELTVLCPHASETKGKTEAFDFYTFCPSGLDKRFQRVLEEVSPDVIHIFGTEYAHSLRLMEAAEKLGLSGRVLVSIQGLVSVYSKHYEAFLPERVTRKKSLRDLIRGGGIRTGKLAFAKEGEHEIALLKKTHHVMGRTDWDQACAFEVNPKVRYYFGGESLRPAFYENRWNAEKMEPYSIFCSQCSYPIKGFHLMLEAMPSILRDFPEAKLYVAGADPRTASFTGRLRQTYYTRYIVSLIRKLKLEDRVVFTGFLSEEKMCEAYLRANVFVCPSSIENSPNSLGEAMLLGTPCVASDVGGVKNMLTHEKEGFVYQADAPYMLAYYVKKIFRDPKLAEDLSIHARAHAQETHDRSQNTEALLKAYGEIMKS